DGQGLAPPGGPTAVAYTGLRGGVSWLSVLSSRRSFVLGRPVEVLPELLLQLLHPLPIGVPAGVVRGLRALFTKHRVERVLEILQFLDRNSEVDHHFPAWIAERFHLDVRWVALDLTNRFLQGIEILLVVRIHIRRGFLGSLVVLNGRLQRVAGAAGEPLLLHGPVFLRDANGSATRVAFRELRASQLLVCQQRTESRNPIILGNAFGKYLCNHAIE